MVKSQPCLSLPSGLPPSTTAKLAAAAANLLQVRHTPTVLQVAGGC